MEEIFSKIYKQLSDLKKSNSRNNSDFCDSVCNELNKYVIKLEEKYKVEIRTDDFENQLNQLKNEIKKKTKIETIISKFEQSYKEQISQVLGEAQLKLEEDRANFQEPSEENINKLDKILNVDIKGLEK